MTSPGWLVILAQERDNRARALAAHKAREAQRIGPWLVVALVAAVLINVMVRL